MHERTLVVAKIDTADTDQVSATGDTTTASGSDTLLSGMTFTPGAGTYHVWFSSSVECNTTGTTQYASIYANDVQVAHTEREAYTEGSIANTSFPIASHARVSIGDGEDIDVRWRTTGGTATMHERTFAYEKVTVGGATFAAAQDTKLTDAVKGTIYRVRFAISNEGDQSSGSVQYQLQVAETDMPASGSYSAVPTGSSGHWQITDSTYITDGEATVNITNGLSDESTTFVFGELKDTGNATNQITLDGDEFTEIEFAVKATINATDLGDYAFRLYDIFLGQEVDTYTKYAEIQLQPALAPIFRSVGPANTNALLTGPGENITLTISGMTATFGKPLSNNIGVGDAIQYDSDNNGSIDAICFISGLSTSSKCIVRAANGRSPTQPSAVDEDWGIYRAYTSLANAETGTENTGIDNSVEDFDTWSGGRDLVANNEQWNIACYNDTTETGCVLIQDWTTSGTQYINIFTPTLSSEVGASQRHDGRAGTGFKIDPTAYDHVIDIRVNNVTINGLEILDWENQATDNSNEGVSVKSDNIFLDNLLIHDDDKTYFNANADAIHMYDMSNGEELTIRNCIMYNISRGGILDQHTTHSVTINIENCTVYNTGVQGAQADADGGINLESTNATVNLRNTISLDNGATNNDFVIAGTQDNVSNNMSSDASAPGAGSITLETAASEFVSVTSGSEDLHLDTVADAIDAGTDLSSLFTQDIDGKERSDGTFDMGADEYMGTFTNVTSYAEVGNSGTTYAITWEDYDNDGYLDLWIGGDGQLYTNDGDGSFSTSTECGTGDRGGNWIDADNGGYMDLFASLQGSFYDNDGDGAFTERAAAANLVGSNLGTTAAIDYDNDGYIDFFFANGNTPPGNEIRENDGDGTFTTIDGATIGLSTGESNGETCAVADVDNDGYIDIYYNASATARLYYNDGDGTFTEDASGAGISRTTDPYVAGVFGDYNNDGWLDFFLNQVSGNQSLLYLNDGDGTFTRQDVAAPDADHGLSRGAAWGDYDNDGDLDILVSNENTTNLLYRNDGGGTFTEVASTEGCLGGATNDTKSCIFADYDNDGDLDIYYSNNSQANRLYRNNTDSNSYLKVRVVGAGSGRSSRDGIGTRIELWDSTESTLHAIREVSGGEGYGNFPPRVQHFGLASAWGGGSGTYVVKAKFQSGKVVTVRNIVPTAESITVGSATWPQTIEIVEPSTPVLIYRSVGPNNTTDLIQGSDNGGIDLAILNGEATFDSSLPSNVGIGDAIEYDSNNSGTIDSICFIHYMTSSTVVAVRAADGNYPANTSVNDQDWSIYRAYISLSNSELGTENTGINNTVENFDTWSDGRDLVKNNEQWNITCFNDTTETGTLTILDWTASGTNYLKVYTPTASSEVGTPQRHDGTSVTGFAIDPSAAANAAIEIAESYTRIEGIRITDFTGNSNDDAGILVSTDGVDNILIDSVIIYDWNDGSYAINGIGVYNNTSVSVRNSIIYNGDNNGVGIYTWEGTPSPELTLSNVTVYNCNTNIQ